MREEVGTGCAGKLRDPSMARTVAGMHARSDALRKVCGGGKQTGVVEGRMSGGIERYFVDEASGQMCATGTFQVTCEPRPPAVPASRQPALSLRPPQSPIPPQEGSPKAESVTPVAEKLPDTSASERELEGVAKAARRSIEDVRRGDTSLNGVRRRAEEAFAELDDL